MLYGCEKAAGEPRWARRTGYRILGEMHIPGRLRMWHVIKELRQRGLWTDAPRVMLDAGGGEGAFAYHVARRFPQWHVVVADNARSTLDRGQRIKDDLRLDNLELREVDLLRLDDRERYDVIVCSDVLEHIEDDQRVVDNLARSLRRDGVLIVTAPSVPQRKHLGLVRWRERRIGFTPEEYGHVRQGYSKASLSSLFESAGLETDGVRWTFGAFGTLMFDLFFVAGDSRPHPSVYLGMLPFYVALAGADLLDEPKVGSAILGVGRK